MTDKSQKDQQNPARRLVLPSLTRKASNKGKAAASFSQTISIPTDVPPPVVPQQQRNIKRFCIGLPDAPFFVPRDKLYPSNLQHLADDLAEKRLQILHGVPGCGKTALARQYASQNFQGLQGEFPGRRYTSVFWLDATKGSLQEALELTFKTQMELQPGQNWLLEFTEKLRAYEADLVENEAWLLVVDGCDNEQRYQDYLNLPGHLLKKTGRGHIILTTRRTPDSIQYPTYVYLLREIEEMANEVDEARELLMASYFNRSIQSVKEFNKRAESVKTSKTSTNEMKEKLKYPRSALLEDTEEMQAAIELVAKLWYKPRLICAMGKYMYQEYKTPKQLLPYMPGEMIQDPLLGIGEYKDPFSGIFADTFRDVIQDYNFISLLPDSREILMLCAFLSRERIPRLLIDFRPENNSPAPLYSNHIIQPGLHMRPLRVVGFLKYDEENSNFLHLRVSIRDLVHHYFQPQANETPELRKASESGLRRHQVYAIHTVSTVFLGLTEAPDEYPSYASHIMKCIKYLGESAIQKYIHDHTPFMLDTVFRFLSTVGHYLRQYPQNEGVYSISEVTDTDEKMLEMNSGHLFELALQIYHLWPYSERMKPERIQILHKMLPSLHEHFLYKQNGPELKKIEDYYPALQELDAGDDENIGIHYDLGSLKSDLNDFTGAESQFDNLGKKLADASAMTSKPQNVNLILRQAEIQISRATNKARQAFHYQDRSQTLNTNGKGPNSDIGSAIEGHQKAGNSLEALPDKANFSEEMQKRIEDLEDRCTIGNVILPFVKTPSSDTAPVSDVIYEIPPIKEIEKYRCLLEKKFTAITPPQKNPYLTYLQLVVDLSNLAEVYRRLGEEEEEQKGLPPHRIPYFEYSKDYSLCALTCYDYFYRIYPEKHLQVQVILQTAWANYKENPLYEMNENKTPTRMLRDLQKSYRQA